MAMRKIFSVLVLILFLTFAIFKVSDQAYSDELDDISKKIAELSSALSSSKQATAPFETQLAQMKNELDAITLRVNGVEQDIANKKVIIAKGYVDLEKQRDIFNQAIRNYYIKHYLFSPFLIFISSNDAQDATRLIAYQRKGAQNDKDTITNTALKIVDLEERKAKLEGEEKRLSGIKASLAGEKEKVQKLVDGAKAYQTTLSTQIAELSAKQQSILNQRLSSLNIPRSAGTSVRGCSDDRGVNPGFSPRFAFFTYGAPHRNGMSQYGAYARAKEQQGEEQILQIYYPNMTLKKDYDQGVQISTTTGWSGTIEDYVKRIYEVPDSWTDNNLAVLKAQAVAARTYALNYKIRAERAGKDSRICTTEGCQVFKSDPKGGNWEQAVNATAGWVLMDGGDPGFTQYASTHGGYILNLGKFDGRVGNPSNFSELNERAYDRESPWFYCDWGSRSQYNGTAWLTSSEVADIANVILLARKDSSAKTHLYQVDKPNPEGTDTWDANKVRDALGSDAISSATDVSVSVDFGSGKTTNVNISGKSFTGDEFKNWFNLRAPANIQIVGPLYNIEMQ
jgi:peptidoglycan hydrolase-like amidase